MPRKTVPHQNTLHVLLQQVMKSPCFFLNIGGSRPQTAASSRSSPECKARFQNNRVACLCFLALYGLCGYIYSRPVFGWNDRDWVDSKLPLICFRHFKAYCSVPVFARTPQDNLIEVNAPRYKKPKKWMLRSHCRFFPLAFTD